MILVSIVIIVAGFFFPPLWLLLAVYGMWVAFFRSPMRAMVIKKDILDMVNRGETLAEIKVVFKDALTYAKENGGDFDGDTASMNLHINGEPWRVLFRQGDLGTWVILRPFFEDDRVA